MKNIFRRFSTSETASGVSHRFPPSNERLPKMLLSHLDSGKLEPFDVKYSKMTSRYPRRRLDFFYDPSKLEEDISKKYFNNPDQSPIHQVFNYGTEDRRRLSVKQIRTIFAAPIGVYSLYTLMNDELYDVPSKVSIAIAISGYFYLMSHVNSMRAFDARTVHIDKNLENFYLGYKKSSHVEKYENVSEDSEKRIEAKILESQNQDGIFQYTKVPQKNILFFGFSKVLDYINDGHYPDTALDKYQKKKRAALEREDKSPMIGTLKELWGSRKEPLSMVFWSEEAQDYAVSEIRLDCLDEHYEDKVDYLQNLAEGYSTQFFD